MKQLGIWMMALGILSIPMKLVGLQFMVLCWMDAFGATTGWVLRAVVIGLGFYFIKRGDGWSTDV
jgi:hypothetical protein